MKTNFRAHGDNLRKMENKMHLELHAVIRISDFSMYPYTMYDDSIYEVAQNHICIVLNYDRKLLSCHFPFRVKVN